MLLSSDVVTVELNHGTITLPRLLTKPLTLKFENNLACINADKRVFGVIVSYLIEEIRFHDYWCENDFVCSLDIQDDVIQLAMDLKFTNLIKMINRGFQQGLIKPTRKLL